MNFVYGPNESALIVFFIAMNLLAFFVMMIDKVKAKHKSNRRISEGVMFFMATAFGSLGVYIGMFLFHHKTRKWYFLLGIPLLAIENSALLYLVYVYWFK